MQRRIRPAPVSENAYGTAYPAPREYVLDMSPLSGGLNLWELDYRLDKSQSPDTLNMYWKDGALSSRPGQEFLYDPSDEEHEQDDYGAFYACYERPWNGKIIAQKGKHLYKIDKDTGEHELLYSGTLTELPGGTFFVFGNDLYYMNGAEYIKITSSLIASEVVGYVPIILLGVQPATGLGGTAYQDENRLSSGKRISYTQTDPDNKTFQIPRGLYPLDANPVTVVANGVTYVESGGAFTVDRTNGTITFSSASIAAGVDNVVITIYKTNYLPDGVTPVSQTILGCNCATVYGGDLNLAIVCGGNSLQPNAYFWSGNTSVGLDPTYFPFDYYNYAGSDNGEYITGFGKQQSMLVIFKQRSIGKSYFSVKRIPDTESGKEYLKLPYTPINDSIGCDVEGSIRLIQNNLVFANTYGGVYVLLDSTAYGENTVSRISRNVNGDGETKGLLYDLRKRPTSSISSFDDDQRYWLVANDHAYLWDYTISSFRSNEGKISWFYFENILARGWFKYPEGSRYFSANGGLVNFSKTYSDFGGVIPRKYVFATQFFGTYEVLKEVTKVVFAVRTDDDPAMTITYNTDYEGRQDLTPIYAYSWRLVPRNLSHRSLKPIPFAFTAVRIPRTFHIRHFQMTLTNNTINTGMSIVSAQIFYRYNREDR